MRVRLDGVTTNIPGNDCLFIPPHGYLLSSMNFQ